MKIRKITAKPSFRLPPRGRVARRDAPRLARPPSPYRTVHLGSGGAPFHSLRHPVTTGVRDEQHAPRTDDRQATQTRAGFWHADEWQCLGESTDPLAVCWSVYSLWRRNSVIWGFDLRWIRDRDLIKWFKGFYRIWQVIVVQCTKFVDYVLMFTFGWVLIRINLLNALNGV